MIYQFTDHRLSHYNYDDVRDVVFNINTPDKPLLWSRTYPKRVTLSTLGPVDAKKRGRVTSAQIRNMITPLKTNTNAIMPIPFAGIAPDHEYIMFDTVNKVSQYFYAGTTITDALAKFARRSVTINPKDIQILDPKTGKISKVKVKVVETYSLE